MKDSPSFCRNCLMDWRRTMKKYFLFLDESNIATSLKNFVLAGCIIEEEMYKSTIIPYVNKLKNAVFETTDVNLHEYEIRLAKEEPYIIMRNKDKRHTFWRQLKNIFKMNDFNTIAVAINLENYKNIYNYKSSNNEYFVALQIILENFVHFLEHNDGQGIIYIEQRNDTDAVSLKSHYYTIVANGTLFISKETFQKRLLDINFLIKEDNNIGLQLADFIPNPINRYCSGENQKSPSLYEFIDSKLYDGFVNMKDRFGLKVLP